MTRWSSAALALLALADAAGAPTTRHAFERPCMGTLFHVIIYSDKAPAEVEAAAHASFSLAGELDACLSDYRADNEVGRLHRSPAGERRALSTVLSDVIRRSLELSKSTSGAFDPARGALTRLWRMAKRTGTLPAPDDLAAALEASGFERLVFDPAGHSLVRKSELTRLDFGGIAKGYAADAMLELLRERGFPMSSIAAGGDARCGDAPTGQPGWRVAIRPGGTAAPPARVLNLSNAAVSTSGNAEQSIEIGGVRYSHILDPGTGLGLTSGISAVVIAPTATESDALATGLCVLGEQGLPLLEARHATEAALFSAEALKSPMAQTSKFPK